MQTAKSYDKASFLAFVDQQGLNWNFGAKQRVYMAQSAKRRDTLETARRELSRNYQKPQAGAIGMLEAAHSINAVTAFRANKAGV